MTYILLRNIETIHLKPNLYNMDLSSYKSFLKKEYPSAYGFLKQHLWSPVFFSESVPLSAEAYQQMKSIVRSLFHLKNREDYQKSLSIEVPSFALKKQKQDSILMAYDFHLDGNIPKLIEVNTNASGFLLVNSFYQFKNLSYKEEKESLKKSFQFEWEKFKKGKEGKRSDITERQLTDTNNTENKKFIELEANTKNNESKKNDKKEENKKITSPQKVVLIDEDPLNQKMAIEFFMYKDFFQSMGWPFEICDSQSIKIDDKGFLYTSKGDKVDFVYNRSTDFYFENHPHLAKAYFQGTCAISPNPREYCLLSDKVRLCDWSFQKDRWPELKQIEHHIPFSKILNSQNRDEIWKNRKKYFFKNSKGYSGKMAYRGSGLTRRKFNELCDLKNKILVQEFIPAGTIKDTEGKEWKVDFRAYVYEDTIQQLTARSYQGQLTNFREKGSGFATITLVE